MHCWQSVRNQQMVAQLTRPTGDKGGAVRKPYWVGLPCPAHGPAVLGCGAGTFIRKPPGVRPRRQRRARSRVARCGAVQGRQRTTLFDKAPAVQDVADIRTLKAVGIHQIRIPIDPVWVLSWPAGGVTDEKLRRLDAVVCAALRNGIVVILDNHRGDLHPVDASSEASLPRLGAAWDRFAARYAASARCRRRSTGPQIGPGQITSN